VKHEIIEDGALGKKVKESGFKMKMVRGDDWQGGRELHTVEETEDESVVDAMCIYSDIHLSTLICFVQSHLLL